MMISQASGLDLHHSRHPHATATHHRRRSCSLDLCFDNCYLCGSEERSNTASINKSGTDDLEGVKDTSLDHVDVLALSAVKALVEVVGILISELANNDGTLSTGVLDDLAGGVGDGVLDDGDTELLVEVVGLDVLEGVDGGLEKTSSTTGKDTLLNGSAGGVQSIDNAVLLLADLDLGGTANLDDGNTARELGETLLELLLLVLGGAGVSHNTADLLAALGNGVLGSRAVKEDGVLLGDGDGASLAEHLSGGLLELDVEVVAEEGSVGQDSEIAENGLAVVAEAGGLDGGDLELATELVEDADSKSLTVNVLSNDEEGTALLLGSLEGGDDVLDGGDLLLGEEDQRVLELDLGALGVGDEVGGDVATVELHALGDLELVLDGLALLDCDDTLLADLLHGVGEELANVCVAVGRDSGDLGDLLAGGDLLLVCAEVLNDGLNSGLGTAPQVHGVASGGNVLNGLREDGTSEDGGGCGTVTSDLVGLGGNVLEETSTEVLELVLKSDSLGNGDTICCLSVHVLQHLHKSKHTLGDLGRAVAGLDQDVATLGAEGCRDSASDCVDTLEQGSTALNAKLELLSSLSAAGAYNALCAIAAKSYLVGEPLLLEVEAPGAGLQSRSPRAGCESSLHYVGIGCVYEMEISSLAP